MVRKRFGSSSLLNSSNLPKTSQINGDEKLYQYNIVLTGREPEKNVRRKH